MTAAEIIGWAAAALMVSTFACRQARLMRPLAVMTNLAFIGYGALAALPPVLTLHLLLLPINLWRWRQCRRDAGPPSVLVSICTGWRITRSAARSPRRMGSMPTLRLHPCPEQRSRVVPTRRTVGSCRGSSLSTRRTTS